MIRPGHKFLRKFLHSRKGTAEVIGTIMFIVILIFFFSNIYLWHDQATKQMNTMLSEKMNTPVSLTATAKGLNVTNNGGEAVVLSRLWVNDSLGSHVFADLENVGSHQILVPAGSTITLALGGSTQYNGSSINATWGNPITVFYAPTGAATFTILTTLGNTASCVYPPIPETSIVMGDFLPDYHSFQWAVFDNTLTNQTAWASNWNVNVPNGDFACYRINMTYRGSGPLTLSPNTELGIVTVANSQGSSNRNFFAYIGNCTASNGDKVFTLSYYNSQTQQTFNAGQTMTLYFYADYVSGTTGLVFDTDTGLLPISLWLNLMIYSTGTYSQSFPLMGLSYNGP